MQLPASRISSYNWLRQELLDATVLNINPNLSLLLTAKKLQISKIDKFTDQSHYLLAAPNLLTAYVAVNKINPQSSCQKQVSAFNKSAFDQTSKMLLNFNVLISSTRP